MAEEPTLDAITAISVKGFKSFLDEQRVEIRPLTLLAGANSSGKSSAVQPLLLLKQTLEAPFDPGPLLLDGPNIRFTSASQFFSKAGSLPGGDQFSLSIETSRSSRLENRFERAGDFGVVLLSTEFREKERVFFLTAETKGATRQRCFFDFSPIRQSYLRRPSFRSYSISWIRSLVLSILHVPGLRGNPARAYRTAAAGRLFPGTFENYVASVILAWQTTQDSRLEDLDRSLQFLGLTGQVRSKAIDATQVEILVGRLPTGSDLVNIADVGFGVSQVLPVLVALLVAKPGQLVYLEQPELHLHPRAQQALATVLADAAKRGVRVVAETHSSILLLAVQTLVAEGKLSPDLVKLHWFQRDERGATKVTSADLDQLGAYGDWPQDFGEVEAAVDNRYLDAVESKAFSRKKRAKK